MESKRERLHVLLWRRYRLAAVFILLVSVVLVGWSYRYGRLAQVRGMERAGLLKDRIELRLGDDDRFDEVVVTVRTSELGSLHITGEVESDSVVDELERLVELMEPVVPVKWRLEVKGRD